MTDELQAFSDSLLAARPQVIAPELLPRIAACIAAPDIGAHGARFAARIAIVRQLSRLPFLTLEAIGRLDPGFKALLLTYLQHEPLLDEALEDLLCRLRRAILMDVRAGAAPDAFGLDLIAALAIFCFGAEYIFAETDSEVAALPDLARRATPAAIATYACYRPLTAAPAFTDGLFAKLIQTQVTEPAEERALAATLPALAPTAHRVTDPVSRQVQAMYEENPYPRWRMLRREPGLMRGGDHRDILIAGCGSGRHALLWARNYPAARVTAIDLSRASLAYGLRQARALGVANVDFRHGDILALAGMEARYDLVSAIGVIHHMADPLAGLKALAHVLAPAGVMELGVYTQSGRPEVAAAENLRRTGGIPATPDGIRYLRAVIRGLPEGHPARAARDGLDFYSMSGCRDYLFHVQEHRFTLPDVDAMLRAVGLRLTHIGLKTGSRADFRRGAADETDLLQWHAYEQAHPGCFGSMYEMTLARA